MRMLMPSHAKHVKHYKDTQPLFTRYGIESQLDAMFSPVVQLRSGGYIVINQAEALVAIDVNSGRATREHHIEDTALKTNCEAAEEIARQLRLRDLAGLIVIDFIDMDEGRNNRTVERRLKDALKHDRARIQVGRISHFGLLEMSRQRIRTSVLESSTEKCPICGGSGHVRSVSSVALQLLRAIEEMLIKGATHNLIVRTRAEVALYVLNHKRAHLRALEERFRITITVSADPAVTGQQSYVIDRGEQVHTPEAARILAAQQPQLISPVEDVEEEIEADEQAEEPEVASAEAAEAEVEPQPEGDREGGRKRRRRRGRGGRGRGVGPREGAQPFTHDAVPEHAIAHEDHDAGSPEEQGLGQPQPRPEGASLVKASPTRAVAGDGAAGGVAGATGNAMGMVKRHSIRANPGQSRKCNMRSRKTALPVLTAHRPIRRRRRSKTTLLHPHRKASPPPQADRSRRADARPSGSRLHSPAKVHRQASSASSPPTPVISSTSAEELATPKRGWWGKRLLGDKG